jgi:hypothetical protein
MCTSVILLQKYVRFKNSCKDFKKWQNLVKSFFYKIQKSEKQSDKLFWQKWVGQMGNLMFSLGLVPMIETSGLYYKHIMIVNDDSRVSSK